MSKKLLGGDSEVVVFLKAVIKEIFDHLFSWPQHRTQYRSGAA